MAYDAGDPDSGASAEPAALKAGEKRESEWNGEQCYPLRLRCADILCQKDLTYLFIASKGLNGDVRPLRQAGKNAGL